MMSAHINAEEGAGGIRSVCINPGEVATEILDSRPVPPSAADRALMLQAEDIAAAAVFAACLPQRATVADMTILPTDNQVWRPFAQGIATRDRAASWPTCRPPPSPSPTLQAFIADIFAKAGTSREEGGRIAHHLIGANLAGHDSHGVIRVPRYVLWLENGRGGRRHAGGRHGEPGARRGRWRLRLRPDHRAAGGGHGHRQGAGSPAWR